MQILDGKEQEYVNYTNAMEYFKDSVRYAETWAELIEEAIEKYSNMPLLEVVNEYAWKLKCRVDMQGIKGAYYDLVLEIIKSYWKYGREFKQWHGTIYRIPPSSIDNNSLSNCV